MLWQLFIFSFQSNSTWMSESRRLWLMHQFLMSNYISLMEGIWSLENILSSDILYSSLIQIKLVERWWLVSGILVIYLIDRVTFGLLSWMVSTSLKRMSQFFWMKEQKRFLILFSGLPGRYLLIYDHLLPILLYSSKILWSSSSLHSYFFMRGSSLLMNLSLICLPFLEPSISARSFQFFPYFLISFLIVSSSSEDHILWFLPSCESLRYLWRHWFQFLSCMSAAISAHFLGSCWQSYSSWLSSSLVHVFTFLLVTCWFFCLTYMLMVLPSLERKGMTNYACIFFYNQVNINIQLENFAIQASQQFKVEPLGIKAQEQIIFPLRPTSSFLRQCHPKSEIDSWDKRIWQSTHTEFTIAPCA